MKTRTPTRRLTHWFALALFASIPGLSAQRVKLDRCEPSILFAGTPQELVLHGGGLEHAGLWTSFPATVERLDEKAPRFRITTDYVGPGAIRAHSQEGVSNLVYLTCEARVSRLTNCEKKTRPEEPQEIEIPAVINGVSPKLASHFYQFTAKAGQPLELHARAMGSNFDSVLVVRSVENRKRLAMADDSDLYGADSWLQFDPPADGAYLIELMDSQYRGGLAFQLRIGPPPEPAEEEWIGNQAVLGPDDPFLVLHHEEGDEPSSITKWEAVQGAFDSESDEDVFSVMSRTRSFFTVIPDLGKLRSPAILRFTLTKADGSTVLETATDDFENRPVRTWLEAGQVYHLAVREAFGRKCSYFLDIGHQAAPFDLSVPGQREKKHPLPDKFLAVPGGPFVVPVQCQRHGFEPAIRFCLEASIGCSLVSGSIAEKQGNGTLRVRMPKDLPPGELRRIWVTGLASDDDHDYQTPLRTKRVLAERDPRATIPESVDGALAVRVIESPVTVEVNPPEAVTRGEAAKIPVKLVWREENRKFNTTLNLTGLPDGLQAGEKKLNNKDTTTGFDLKVENAEVTKLKNLRVEVRLDYHGQALLVESEPFAIRIKENDEQKD